MIVEDQSAVVEFLSSPAIFGVAAVERVETHASIVFLAGSRALKLKRAVKYDYLDFSTLEQRRQCCEAEVRLNRRTAPGLYRGTLPVTRVDGGMLSLDGAGAIVEWLVEMVRFDQDFLFDRLAARGALDLALMPPLAAAIVRLHREAEARPDHGGRQGMAWVVEGNARGFSEYGPGILTPALCFAVTRGARVALDECAVLLEARRSAGAVRQCHGDLHLRNIVLVGGRPTLFDCVEFNDEIACIDVLYDLAFLLMDLWRRGLRAHANAVWNSYLAESEQLDGLSLMPFFLSCRAAIRAKTSATSATLERDPGRREELARLAYTYLGAAAALLAPPAPRLIAVGGRSGSGKSTLARGLAPEIGAVPGAVVIRSDQVRKRLCGVAPGLRLPPDAYRNEVSRLVYQQMADQIMAVLRSGHAAIADATYADSEDRASIERLASQAGVPFSGVWLDAPERVLIARVTGRRGDASDADAAVVHAQQQQDIGPVVWHRLDASTDTGQVLSAARDLVAA